MHVKNLIENKFLNNNEGDFLIKFCSIFFSYKFCESRLIFQSSQLSNRLMEQKFISQVIVKRSRV